MKKIPTNVIVFTSALLFGACGGTGSPSDTTSGGDTTVVTVDTTAAKIAGVTITVTVGVDSGADRTEKVERGTHVTLSLTNPTANDEFHLHGYDMTTGETEMGETATIMFIADKAGEFQVESHMSEEVYVTIIVSES